MFINILNFKFINDIILNTLFLSIPEEFFVVMFTLILIGEFDYWREEECRKVFDGWDYFRVFLPVILGALISNILRFLNVDTYMVSILTISSIFVSIILTGDIWGDSTALKWIKKAFVFLMLASLITITVESSYAPFIIYGSGISLKELNDNVLMNFLSSLPTRVIQYSILAFLFAKKRTLLQGKILKTIFESSGLTIFTSVLLSSNVIFMIAIMKAIGSEKVLSHLPFELRAIIIIGTCIFPLLNIFICFSSIYYVKNRESKKNQMIVQKLNYLSNNINLFSDSKKNDGVKWKLFEIQQEISEISKNLS
ncbi:MAG: hypothetical protein Q8942_03440 [Bacillota bacterium]|nr:hypothetical protein [Bacillota bacterium]